MRSGHEYSAGFALTQPSPPRRGNRKRCPWTNPLGPANSVAPFAQEVKPALRLPTGEGQCEKIGGTALVPSVRPLPTGEGRGEGEPIVAQLHDLQQACRFKLSLSSACGMVSSSRRSAMTAKSSKSSPSSSQPSNGRITAVFLPFSSVRNRTAALMATIYAAAPACRARDFAFQRKPGDRQRQREDAHHPSPECGQIVPARNDSDRTHLFEPPRELV
jgi:hypothetical protein